MIISYSQLCRIREIINNYDPEEYFNAPSDEYYDLIDKMLEEIEVPQKECIKKVVYETFGDLFDKVDSKEQFVQKLDNIVKEIRNCLMSDSN